MGELQAKLGNKWNDIVVDLFNALGWVHIGDKDMDLPGTDDEDHGVDALLIYENPGKTVRQTVLVESKHYAKGSLSPSKLRGWIEILHKKQNMLRASGDFQKEFPVLSECSDTNLGVIMCWVHDGDEEYLSGTFQNYLTNAIISSSARSGVYSRIMVLDNRRIVRVVSMLQEIRKANSFCFVYPAGVNDNIQTERSTALTIEYLMSNIIIAECQYAKNKITSVFYFGEMSVPALETLIAFLSKYQRLDKDRTIKIYHYENDERTDNVISHFKGKDYKNIKFVRMQQLSLTSEPSLNLEEDE